MQDNSESANLTKLNTEFTIWFTFFKKSKDKQLEEFEDNLKEIGSFGTAEEFWGVYQHMKRPNSLPRGCEFFLFKRGIKPLWEDSANQDGGRFLVSTKKHQSNNKLWEDLLMATIALSSDQLRLINGVVLNVRTYEVFISIWTTELTTDDTNNLRNWMKTVLELPPDAFIDYKKHPNNSQLLQKQELLVKEEEERKRRLTEIDTKKDDLPSERKYRIQSENIELQKENNVSAVKVEKTPIKEGDAEDKEEGKKENKEKEEDKNNS